MHGAFRMPIGATICKKISPIKKGSILLHVIKKLKKHVHVHSCAKPRLKDTCSLSHILPILKGSMKL